MIETSLLLNTESFESRNINELREAIKRFYELTLQPEFISEFGYDYYYYEEDRDRIFSLKFDDSNSLYMEDIPSNDIDLYTLFVTTLSNVKLIDNEEEKEKRQTSFSKCKDKGYFGLLSLSHQEYWRQEKVEDEVLNIFDRHSSINIYNSFF